MEWVEITAKTVEDAKEKALDQLGIHMSEGEFEILEEPKVGLFGRLKGEARVRARVKPRMPRAKEDRNRRRRTNNGNRQNNNGNGNRNTKQRTAETNSGDRRPKQNTTSTQQTKKNPTRTAKPEKSVENEQSEPREIMNAQQQAAIALPFVEGVVAAFGLTADVVTVQIDDDSAEVHVNGEGLGLLIGKSGNTMNALQDLARTYTQRVGNGEREGRLRVDVAGYREKRRVSLAAFAVNLAEKAKVDQHPIVLEPMNAADRKVVHDAVSGVEGVHTRSEGEDRWRRVVLEPSPTTES